MAEVAFSQNEEILGERQFTKVLISLYRNYPELWQVKSEHYLDKNKKDAALQNIVNALKQYKPDFDVYKLKQKINILRTNFNREYKAIESIKLTVTSPDDIPEPKVWYYNDLLFIKDQAKMEKNETSEIGNLQDNLIESLPTLPQQPGPRHPKRKKTPTNDHTNDSTGEPFGLTTYYKNLDTESEVIAKGWALKLARLDPSQRHFAEKIINDTLFEAAMGTLTRHGVSFLTSSQSPVPYTSLHSASTNISSPSPSSFPIKAERSSMSYYDSYEFPTY